MDWPPGHGPNEVYTVEIFRDSRTGVVHSESWEMNGKRHRVGGPAHIERDRETGAVTHEGWFMNGKLHREDGPASLRRDPLTGRITRSWWCVNGERVPTPRSRSGFAKYGLKPRSATTPAP
jgi:hypothetical protein